jgi:hypothetical protein
MYTYIVRIYRRKHGETENLIGLVEDPITSCKRPFKTVDEMCSILSSPTTICRRKKARDTRLYRRKDDKPNTPEKHN